MIAAVRAKNAVKTQTRNALGTPNGRPVRTRTGRVHRGPFGSAISFCLVILGHGSWVPVAGSLPCTARVVPRHRHGGTGTQGTIGANALGPSRRADWYALVPAAQAADSRTEPHPRAQ